MATLGRFIDNRYRLVIYAQFALIVFFLLACSFNGVIPICHWLFNCDHMVMH